MTTRYATLSALSGLAWAGIAWLLGATRFPRTLWGGIAVAPLIGIVAGWAYLPAYGRSRWIRILAALGTLYLAAFLFGVAVGVADVLRLPGRAAGEVVFENVAATLWGVTFTGYVVALWPLAFANHSLLARFRREA